MFYKNTALSFWETGKHFSMWNLRFFPIGKHRQKGIRLPSWDQCGLCGNFKVENSLLIIHVLPRFSSVEGRGEINPRRTWNISRLTEISDSLLAPHQDKAKHGQRQWRTQKIFMRGFGSRSYGGYLFLVCAVCDVTIWRVSKPTFWRSLLT